MNLKFIVKIPFVKTWWLLFELTCYIEIKEKKQTVLWLVIIFVLIVFAQKKIMIKKMKKTADDERYVICDISKLVL